MASRGIPSRNTVYGSSPSLNFWSPSSVFCRYSFYCINHFFNSCIRLSLTPVRVIFLEVNRCHIAAATVPDIKTEALCILISCTHHFSTVNVCLGGLGGFRRSGRSRGATARGTGRAGVSSVTRARVTRVAGISSVPSIATRGGFGCGNLLVALVVCPRLISGAATGGLLGACTPLTVRAYAVPALEFLHLCGGQRTVIVAGCCGLLGSGLTSGFVSGLVSGFVVSCLLSAGF